MRTTITSNLLIRLQKLEFSFDEIVLEFEKYYKEKGAVGVLETILEYIDSLLLDSNKVRACCDNHTYYQHGKTSKTILTSTGKLKLSLRRLKCKVCEETRTPFLDFFEFKNKRNYSYEFQKKVCEQSMIQSYRRTATTINSIGNIKLSKNKAYRITMNCNLNFQNLSPKVNLISIMADGTGYKPHKKEQRSEIKIVIGLDHRNKIHPVGSWVSKGWKAIGSEIKKANHANKKLIFKPIANTLITDGEIALIEGLKELAYHQQRCQWHFVRDFKYAYVYGDQGDKSTCQQIQSEIMNQINYCMDSLSKTELEIVSAIAKAEVYLKELEHKLDNSKKFKARIYVKNAREELFTHLKIILTSGEEIYRTTSKIERVMRELARRFKRIAHNWSEKGAEKLCRMLMRFTFDKEGWDEVWSQKIKISGNIKMEINSFIPHNLGH